MLVDYSFAGSNEFGDSIMTEMNIPAQSPQRKPLTKRRLTLLGSVALVALAVGFGASAYDRFNDTSWLPAAHAFEGHQGPNGFADLVAKVKPAVIAVRVKIDQEAELIRHEPKRQPTASSLHEGIAVRGSSSASLTARRPACRSIGSSLALAQGSSSRRTAMP